MLLVQGFAFPRAVNPSRRGAENRLHLNVRLARRPHMLERRSDSLLLDDARRADRIVEGLRQANGIVAGLAKMPWRRCLAFNALGAALWGGDLERGGLPRREPPHWHL